MIHDIKLVYKKKLSIEHI